MAAAVKTRGARTRAHAPALPREPEPAGAERRRRLASPTAVSPVAAQAAGGERRARPRRRWQR
eukprot:7390686-Prymnesium_polylepis.2